MRRPIIENPENPSRGAIRLADHYVLDQTGEGHDSCLGLTPPEQFRPAHIPGGQIAQRPLSRILKFHLLSLSCVCTKTRMPSMSRLDAGLLIGGYHKVSGTEWKSIPYPLIEIQHPAGLLLKLGIPGENPAPVLPRLDGIFSKPAPDCRAAHVSYNASLNGFSGNIAGAPSRQRSSALRGQFTGQGLYSNDDVRGKNRTAVRVWIDLPGPGVVHHRTSFSIYSRSAGAVPASALLHRFPDPAPPSGSPWPGPPNNKVTYISGQSFLARHARPQTAQSGKGSSLASGPPCWRIYPKDTSLTLKCHYNTSLYL